MKAPHMKPALRRFACLSLIALSGAVAPRASFAQERNVDPDTLPPRERNFALYGPLGNYDPAGLPAASGCTWSRLQVPTSQGLRWVAHESCDPGMMR
jgi:hypothetical protein